MKKVLSLLLVLGCVVLFSQMASATTYTAQVTVGGTFSFDPSLVLTTNYTTAAGTITWSSFGDAFAGAENWKTANVAIKVGVTNQLAEATVKLYQDNADISNGVYQSTIPYHNSETDPTSTSHAGLIRADSYGGEPENGGRFTMGMIVSTATNVTVNPTLAAYAGGFYMKDTGDTDFASASAYYTILSDQGYLSYITAGNAGGFTPFSSGTLYIHFGANFKNARPGTYGTKSITLEVVTAPI